MYTIPNLQSGNQHVEYELENRQDGCWVFVSHLPTVFHFCRKHAT